MHLTIVEVNRNSLFYELGMLYIFDINRVSLHEMSGFIWFLFWYASSVPILKNENFFLQIVELYRNQTNEWISVMMQVFSEGKLGAYASHEDICLISTTWSWYYLFIVSHI